MRIWRAQSEFAGVVHRTCIDAENIWHRTEPTREDRKADWSRFECIDNGSGTRE
jgi:hypothetical protein